MTPPAIALRLLVELARQDRAELAGERFEAAGITAEIGRELVVCDDRRNGGDETERGREERLGDAGGDDGERGVLRGGDRLEAVHDAPDRAEEADEGRRRTDRRE